MTDAGKAKLEDQIKHLPDFEVSWIWQLCQREMERRDAAWPTGKNWRAFKVPNKGVGGVKSTVQNSNEESIV